MKSRDMKCIEHYNILWRLQGPYIINENGHYLFYSYGGILYAAPLDYLDWNQSGQYTSEAKFERCTWIYQNNHIVSLIDQQVATMKCSDRGSTRDCSTQISISPKETSNKDVDQHFFFDYQGRPNK